MCRRGITAQLSGEVETGSARVKQTSTRRTTRPYAERPNVFNYLARIQGLPISAVQEHDHIRKEAVQKLIHQFETHPNKEALQADLKQNHAFNPFSEQSKDMIYSMGNMEYFEVYEITPKIQCSNCMTYWPKSIVCCKCGTCLRPLDRVRKLNSDRYDVLSIPNYVIKKGPTHGARGNTERDRESTIMPNALLKRRKKGVQITTG